MRLGRVLPLAEIRRIIRNAEKRLTMQYIKVRAKITVDTLTLPHVTNTVFAQRQKPRRHTRWSTVYG